MNITPRQTQQTNSQQGLVDEEAAGLLCSTSASENFPRVQGGAA